MNKFQHYLHSYELGRMNRRDFLRQTSAAGISVAAAAAMMSAVDAKAQTPKRGGRLRMVFTESSQKEHWDPAKRYSSMMSARNNSVFNLLVEVSPDLKPVPALAESWDASDSADDWVFKLRKGIEFHDGRSLKAADVVYSLNRVRNPETGSGGKSALAGVEDIVAEDDHTVRIKLSAANVDLPTILAVDYLNIIPEGWTDFTTANGTGPFKLKSFEVGRNAIVERNPNYWRDGGPYVDEVETFAISDDVARLNALISGDAHCIQALNPSLIEKVKATDGIELLSTPSTYRVPLIMRTDVAPYDNADVRLALKLVVDRQRYIDIVYRGHATLGNDHPVGQVFPEYCSDIPIRGYDPDQAKSLLKKAGYADYTFEILVSTIGLGAIEGAQIYSQMAAAAGVNVKVQRVPTDGFWDAVWLKKPLCWAHWRPRSTANQQLSAAFESSSPWNDTYWKRPDFDALLKESRATFDPARRKQVYCDMQQMVRDDGGQMIPAFPNILDAYASNVKGIIPHPNDSLGNMMAQNTCWIDA